MLPKSLDTLRIDINSGKVRKAISVCQSDNVQRTLNFQLVNSGTAVDIDNVLFAEILIHKADGHEADNGCVIDGNSIQYTLRTTDIQVLGTNLAQLQLTFKDGQVLTTPTFEINVYSKVLDQNVQRSFNEYTALTEQLVLVTELKTQTDTAKSTAVEAASEATSQAEIATSQASIATDNASLAGDYAERAEAAYEAWAKGTRNGTAVSSGTDGYQDNSKYYSEVSGNSAKDSEAWAVGKRDGEDVESTDVTYHNNAKYWQERANYWYQQAQSIAESFSGALRPMGTVAFANLPSVSEAEAGDMYNISDEFTTTSDFVEGAGITVPLGSNVYLTTNSKWDVLAGSPVTGIKGDSESTYRKGNVNITKTNIGLGNVDNESLGTTSISRIGDGTVKGAIVSLTSRAPRDITSDLTNLSTAISEQNLEKYGYKIGDYFTGTNYKYWLADLDTFYGGYNSYAVVGTHHIGIIVDTLTTSAYLASGTLSGYSTSTLHTFLTGTALPKIKADLKALFGGSTGAEHLIAHDKLYNTVSSWGWSSSNTQSEYISAPTEVQFVGCPIWSGNEYQQGEGDKQLELFRKYKYNAIFGNTAVWTRSIHSASSACFLYGAGDASANGLTTTYRAVGLILFK